MMCRTGSASHAGRGTGSSRKTPRQTCSTLVTAQLESVRQLHIEHRKTADERALQFGPKWNSQLNLNCESRLRQLDPGFMPEYDFGTGGRGGEVIGRRYFMWLRSGKSSIYITSALALMGLLAGCGSGLPGSSSLVATITPSNAKVAANSSIALTGNGTGFTQSPLSQWQMQESSSVPNEHCGFILGSTSEANFTNCPMGYVVYDPNKFPARRRTTLLRPRGCTTCSSSPRSSPRSTMYLRRRLRP
jgi:hypothetical protein